MTNKLFRNQFVVQVPKCKYSDEEYIEKKNEEDRRKKMAIQDLRRLKKIELGDPYLETIIEQDTQDIEEAMSKLKKQAGVPNNWKVSTEKAVLIPGIWEYDMATFQGEA